MPIEPTTDPLVLRRAHVEWASGRVVRADGTEARLGPTERALLRYLVDHRDRDLPRHELLTEVWGYRPTTTSRTLDTTVKTLRRKIEGDPAVPDHLLTVWGTGYRFTPDAAPQVIATDPDPIVGREADLAALERALAGARLVTLLGPGGTGKTRLARELVRRRPDSRFVALMHTTDPADVATAVASAIEAPGDLGAGLVDLGDTLLILDNVEQVPVGELVTTWLAAAPLLRILTTSRVRIGIPHEHLLRLGPLAPADAVTLFRRRADRVRAGACDGQDDGLLRIAGLVEHLPLALELAAARVALLAPADLATRLAARPELLRRDDARHGSLEAVVAWSWALLDPDARSVLAGCAVFAGPFSVADAEAVVVAVHGTVLGHLEALHDASLLVVADGGQLSLPDAVRRFAAAHLPDPLPVWIRHAEHTVARLEGQPPRLLGPERDNLRAVFTRPLGRPDLATRAALLTDQLLASTGPFDARLRVLDDAVAVAPTAELRVTVLLARARARDHAGHPGVEDDLDDARRIAADAGLERLRGHAIARLGTRRLTLGQLDDAWALCTEALAVHRATGDRIGEADGVSNLAFVLVARSDPERAIRALLDALALQQAVGNRVHAAKVMGMIGNAHNELGRPEIAEQWYRRALAEHEASGHLPGVLRMTANVGMIAFVLGRAEEAWELYRRVVLDAADLGEPLVEAIARSNVARCALALGRLQVAEEEAARGLHQARALGARKYEAIAALTVGLVALGVGDPVRAADALTEAITLGREAGDPRTAAYALGYRAALVSDPVPDLDRAAAVMAEIGDAAGVVFVTVARAVATGAPLPEVDPVWRARSEDVRFLLSRRERR